MCGNKTMYHIKSIGLTKYDTYIYHKKITHSVLRIGISCVHIIITIILSRELVVREASPSTKINLLTQPENKDMYINIHIIRINRFARNDLHMF